MLAPWSAKVGPKTVFEPSYLRKSEFARNSTFSNTFGVFGLPHGAPKGTKIAPGRVLDPLGSLFFAPRFSLRFWIVFGSVLGRFWTPKWSPKGDRKRCESSPGEVPGRSWGRLGALLGSACGLGSFLCPLQPFLGPFLASCGAIYGLLGANFRFLGAILVSFSNFWARCSFATCPFAFDRLSLFHLSMSLVSFPIVVVLGTLAPILFLSLFDLWIFAFRCVDVALGPGPCGLRAARLNEKIKI